MNHRLCRFGSAALLLLLLCACTVVYAGTGELEKWTGQHSRMVWVQDHGDGTDSLAKRRQLMLYGYDSRDGKGERQLLSNTANFFKPMLTPDGNYVVVSDRHARKMYLIEWENSRVISLGDGVAVAVWEDVEAKGFLFPKKTTWVYCFSGKQGENKYGTKDHLGLLFFRKAG